MNTSSVPATSSWCPQVCLTPSSSRVATAKVLGIQPTCECEPFYLGASEPFEGSACVVDFARIAQSAQENGGIEIVGPPPF